MALILLAAPIGWLAEGAIRSARPLGAIHGRLISRARGLLR